MTHEYTLAVGGVIEPGPGQDPCAALAWAEGIVLAIGSDEAVTAISRGDSHVVRLDGARVVPAIGAALEVGAPATFDVWRPDGSLVARLRDGRVVEGSLAVSRHASADPAPGH